MHAFSTDYRKDPGPRTLVNRGFWVHDLPRPLLTCRLFKHRPVVDGVGESGERGYVSRWVCCDRCGVRPDPQGSLDPDRWNIGDRYRGPWGTLPPSKTAPARPETTEEGDQNFVPGCYPPGWWPTKPVGVLGGQLVLFGHHSTIGLSVKVGNAGSEHTLAASVQLGWLGGLYLHTERFGTWLQRRLNPVGYQSRVIEVSAHDGHLHWRLWVKRDEHASDTPQWQDGSTVISVRDRLLGPARYSYSNVGEPVTAVVRMPHGDDHEVTLQLQQQTYGRKRGRKTVSWTVHWDCRGGIPTKPGDRGHICGSAVSARDEAIMAGTWPAEATAAIAQWATQRRTRYGYRPPAAVGVGGIG